MITNGYSNHCFIRVVFDALLILEISSPGHIRLSNSLYPETLWQLPAWAFTFSITAAAFSVTHSLQFAYAFAVTILIEDAEAGFRR